MHTALHTNYALIAHSTHASHRVVTLTRATRMAQPELRTVKFHTVEQDHCESDAHRHSVVAFVTSMRRLFPAGSTRWLAPVSQASLAPLCQVPRISISRSRAM